MLPSRAGRDNACMQRSRLLGRQEDGQRRLGAQSALFNHSGKNWLGASSLSLLSVYNLDQAGNAMSFLASPLPAPSSYREVKNETKGELCPPVLGSQKPSSL